MKFGYSRKRSRIENPALKHEIEWAEIRSPNSVGDFSWSFWATRYALFLTEGKGFIFQKSSLRICIFYLVIRLRNCVYRYFHTFKDSLKNSVLCKRTEIIMLIYALPYGKIPNWLLFEFQKDRRVSLDVASTVLIKDPETEGFEPPSRSKNFQSLKMIYQTVFNVYSLSVL